MSRRESCIEPAGASPVRASIGALGSRPQFRGEIPGTTAGRQEPLRREQGRGPQHQVNPAASTDLQSRSRAGHVTAEAIFAARLSEAVGAVGLGGVGGAARSHGSIGNTGDPSGPPVMRQGRSYKPKAKASGVQRESEGAVRLMTRVQDNALRGKGPCFGHAVRRGKREGMVCASGPNFPSGSIPLQKCENSERGSMWTPSVLRRTEDAHAAHEDHR
jgi:hypothetical protein